jgi:hypothetical protein
MIRLGFLALSLAFVLPSCDRGWPDVYWRSGDYTLIAIDTMAQMSLAHNSGNQAVVASTVFSVGADDAYIVVKQHPSTSPGGVTFDSTVTLYFVVEKKKSSDFSQILAGVHGPLNKEEFERLAKTLSLPQFTKTFDELK